MRASNRTDLLTAEAMNCSHHGRGSRDSLVNVRCEPVVRATVSASHCDNHRGLVRVGTSRDSRRNELPTADATAGQLYEGGLDRWRGGYPVGSRSLPHQVAVGVDVSPTGHSDNREHPLINGLRGARSVHYCPQSGEAGFGCNPGTGGTPSPVAGGTAPLAAGKTIGGARNRGLATAAALGERDLPGSPEYPLAGGLTGGRDNNTLARVEGPRYSRS